MDEMALAILISSYLYTLDNYERSIFMIFIF